MAMKGLQAAYCFAFEKIAPVKIRRTAGRANMFFSCQVDLSVKNRCA
jgi:hypothetical protein